MTMHGRSNRRGRPASLWGLFTGGVALIAALSLAGGVALIAALMVTGTPDARRVGPPVMVEAAAPLPSAPGNVTFQVVPAQPTGPPTPAPSPSGSQLPITGDDGSIPFLPMAVGVALILGGALILIMSRRWARADTRANRPNVTSG